MKETLKEVRKSFEEIWSTLTKEQSKYLKDYINRQREGAIKWQQQNSYSKEEVIKILESLVEHPTKPGYKRRDIVKFIEQFKKK